MRHEKILHVWKRGVRTPATPPLDPPLKTMMQKQVILLTTLTLHIKLHSEKKNALNVLWCYKSTDLTSYSLDAVIDRFTTTAARILSNMNIYMYQCTLYSTIDSFYYYYTSPNVAAARKMDCLSPGKLWNLWCFGPTESSKSLRLVFVPVQALCQYSLHVPPPLCPVKKNFVIYYGEK